MGEEGGKGAPIVLSCELPSQKAASCHSSLAPPHPAPACGDRLPQAVLFENRPLSAPWGLLEVGQMPEE